MNPARTLNIPPNPYKRSPIRFRKDLAGRDGELKTIRYYLDLTASGQSPHLALIGQRGVGKTSLLNGAESIAKDLKLLPLRIDLNESKASSPGRFWRDLYQTLALSMAKVGCWGGVQGPIYAELLKMFHSGHPGNLEKAVMQIPYVYSCHQGAVDTIECPDALVINDFEACMVELHGRGFAGMALLIDEADCLGKNIPLLQMFRNIFQVVERCSLLLAGTEMVFPALTEVFSPIPRQFHRIDIEPFSHWYDTLEVVCRPIHKDILPAIGMLPDEVRELHDICGGAPDEVQLYCHHMYRSVETGASARMSLTPEVFHQVLREYRSNSSADLDIVLTAIERLPDELLYKSTWLSRRNLTLEENIKVSILRRELKLDRALSSDERNELAQELASGYQMLFEKGISEIDSGLRIVGAPLSACFWKSFVNCARRERWAWNDDSFADSLRHPITETMASTCGVEGFIGEISGTAAVDALQVLRSGKVPCEFDSGMSDMITSALAARETQVTHVVDMEFRIESFAGKQQYRSRFFENPISPFKPELCYEWIETHGSLLAGNGISVSVSNFNRWQLPSSKELHRLGRISDYQIPEAFGPSEAESAINQFMTGDIQGCMDTFSAMLIDKEEYSIRNNLAFCQLLTGDLIEGLKNATRASEGIRAPLHELNRALGEFLSGHSELAGKVLKKTLVDMRNSGNTDAAAADCVLVLDPGLGKVSSHNNVPVDAAIVINLWRMGEFTRDEMESELGKISPDKAPVWRSTFET